jgi:hypothetical protein
MTDEKKPETPAEFLRRQSEREQSERDGVLKAQQERDDQAARAIEAKHKAVADQIIATWRQTVEKAGEQAGVRFVVLADLSDPGHWKTDSQVRRVVDALAAAGWIAEVVDLSQPFRAQVAHLGKPSEPQPGPVEYKNMKGWRCDGTPRLGEQFFTQRNALIVKWAPN